MIDPLFTHGGPDATGAAPHDFSTNANACGPCPAALSAVMAADASRYPDPQSTRLKAQLGAFHGVDPARIVVAASASEFILRITAAVAQGGGRRVGLPAHSYGDYERAAQAWQLAVVREADAHGDAVRTADLVWCCDPSSPLGQTPYGLAAALEAAAGQGAWVLDRAYAPLRLQGTSALNAAQCDGLWQLWTPNKALGLTGVRAAYAIAPASGAEELQARIERLAPSWPLGAHGAALLDAWTGDAAQGWLRESLDTLRCWKTQQVEMLGRRGWTCLPSDANFFCARPATPDASFVSALRQQGIQLRDCASFGLPEHVRFGVLSPPSQRALSKALPICLPSASNGS